MSKKAGDDSSEEHLLPPRKQAKVVGGTKDESASPPSFLRQENGEKLESQMNFPPNGMHRDEVSGATRRISNLQLVEEDVIIPHEEYVCGGLGRVNHLFDDNMREKSFVFATSFVGCSKMKVCKKIVEHFGYILLSLDEILKKGFQCGTKITKDVSPQIVVRLLSEALTFGMEGIDKILIDGFPRTVKEADEFEAEIAPAKFFFYFSCPPENLTGKGNSDSDVELLQKELQVFETGVQPILEKYKERNVGVEISLGESEGEIWENIEKVFS